MLELPDCRNIVHHKNGFQIQKGNGHKTQYLGFGRTLIEALMIRDICKENNWKPFYKKNRNPSYILKEKGGKYRVQKSYRVNGKRVTYNYGTFTLREDAEAEVELLKKVNWDYDRLLELDEAEGTL